MNKDKNYESTDKMVSHPDHYQSKTGLEVIEVIEAFTSDLTGIEAVDTANVIKYICRWKKKNGLQDLNKAMWYLQNLINHVEEEDSNTAYEEDNLEEKIKESFVQWMNMEMGVNNLDTDQFGHIIAKLFFWRVKIQNGEN